MYVYESNVLYSLFFLYKIIILFVEDNRNINCASWINLFIPELIYLFLFISRNIVFFDKIANNRLIVAEMFPQQY